MARVSLFLVAVLVGCGTLLATGSATAGPPHGGGGGHSSAGHSSAGHYHGGGSYHGGGYYHGGDYHHHYGYGTGLYFSIGGLYPRYYSSGGYYSPGVIQSNYYEPVPIPVPNYREVRPGPTGVTRVRVVKPDPRATIVFDGVRHESSTDVHIFEFSSEAPGKPYPHTIAVLWSRDGKPMREERQVQVAGGSSVVVDFTRPVTQSPPPMPREETP